MIFIDKDLYREAVVYRVEPGESWQFVSSFESYEEADQYALHLTKDGIQHVVSWEEVAQGDYND